jgi:hypothetical protein
MRRGCLIGLGGIAAFVLLPAPGHTVEKQSEAATLRRDALVGPEMELLPEVELPGFPSAKVLSCTLAAFYFDGGEVEWIPDDPSTWQKTDYDTPPQLGFQLVGS